MIENDCERMFALLSEYLEQELPSVTCEELEQHLRHCPPCIQFVRSLRRGIDLCHQLGKSHDTPSPGPEVLAGLRTAYTRMLARRRPS
jgi:predicted anti-sigma-YlaC factor YlaD